ncbi:MAG TPA: caspase family protein [Phycisphaerae bacterium]|nr:caspase family protein [Phycisphaerae bacterium]HUU59764.1 caspase family protein [Phycisphaerae bacterium]
MAKKALIVGINAYRDAPLQGCVNDAHAMHDLLTGSYGFRGEDTRVLCDGRATADAIKHRLAWLVDGAKPGDTLVFHFSGHGSQVRDRGPLDELADHKDEILCPVDLDWKEKVVTDDDLAAYFRKVPKGAKLNVVLDCCHSGTGTRSLRPPGEDAGLPSNPHETRQRFLPMPFDIEARMIGTPLPTRRIGAKPPEWLRTRVKARNQPRNQSRGFWAWLAALLGGGVVKPAPAPAVADRAGVTICPTMGHTLVSGCASTQTSADAYFEGSYFGALTYNLTRVLRESGNRSLLDAHGDVVAGIKRGGFPQDSQLEGPEDMLKAPAFT